MNILFHSEQSIMWVRERISPTKSKRSKVSSRCALGQATWENNVPSEMVPSEPPPQSEHTQ